ncbi:hypothetical protein ACIQ9P_27580 [Kitasatospora sp. NPDC094019]|uniref:hypothetical protein n=1 Tax=Kitasatospora sp. NPDC094019 TaxID=3364091 RepID=UPI00381D2A60
MSGVRRPGALLLAALALAAAPTAAFAEGGEGSSDTGGGTATGPDFASAAACLQEFATVPALGSHGAGPTTCSDGNVVNHAVGALGTLGALTP